MKKLILIGMLLGAVVFAAKITTTGKDWATLSKEHIVSQDTGDSIFNYHWLDKNDTYNFEITTSDFKEDTNTYLRVLYDEKPNNGLKDSVKLSEINKINGFTTVQEFDEETSYFVSYYKIQNSNVQGIYFVDNYIDQKGKKHSKLYFGFDEKSKKVVITDKNGNILEILNYVMAN